MGVLTVLAECEIKGNDEAKGPQTSAKKPRETKTTNSKSPVNRRVRTTLQPYNILGFRA